MPLARSSARIDQFLPLSQVRAGLMDHFTLIDDPHRTGGRRDSAGQGDRRPHRLHHAADAHFCESCQPRALTCTGTLYMCLGQEDAADLRSVIRASESDEPLHRRAGRGDLKEAQRT